MDGLAVVKEIRKMNNYKKTPIVALTAFVLYGDKEDFIAAGCTHYLGKPFEMVQLLNLINNIIKGNLILILQFPLKCGKKVCNYRFDFRHEGLSAIREIDPCRLSSARVFE